MDHSKTFREELAIQYRDIGRPLWEPDPGGYNVVQVGDVGFIRHGYFYCLFNALLPRDAPSYHSSESDPHYPDYVQQLKPKISNHIRASIDHRKDFRSKNVTNVAPGANIDASGPDDVSFSCSGKQGALLYLPFPAQREDTVTLGDFGKWIVSNIYNCMRLAEEQGLGIERMEDIIIVTGRHLAISWARAVFSEIPGRGVPEVSFKAEASGGSVVHLEERNASGAQLEFGPSGENLSTNQCIFVRGYRVARLIKFWPKKIRGLAGPAHLPEPEPEPDTHLQPVGFPDDTDYQDPLNTLLEYIAEQNPSCDLVLVHDDDLKCIENAKPPLKTLQPDALMESLRNSAPKTRQFQCESFSGSENESEGEVTIATVATLSLDVFGELDYERAISSSFSTLEVARPTEELDKSPPFPSPPFHSHPLISSPSDPRSEGLLVEKNRRCTGKMPIERSPHQVKRIDVLPDDVLLEIFYLYMAWNGGETGIGAWKSLVHVCRRWRMLVFASPRRLNLQLFCTPQTRARDTLDIWPALPLIIFGNMNMASSDPDNTIAALEQSNRVCKVDLLLADRLLEQVLPAMQVPFPELTYLHLTSSGEMMPVIPDSFLGGSAPLLQHFSLDGIPFPGLPKLHLSATHLYYLGLKNIPHSGYISPETIVALLSTLSSLTMLYLEFQSSQSRPDSEIRSLPPPKRSIIPALKILHFRGVAEYLEELVTRIDAPQLDVLDITFLDRIDCVSPRLVQFIICTPILRALNEVRVQFDDSIASVKFRSSKLDFYNLLINISCREPDGQLSSIEQICNSLLDPLSTVEDLYIEHKYRQLVWKDDAIKNTLWFQLLLPFTAVKKLHRSKEFAPGIAAAVQKLDGGRIIDVRQWPFSPYVPSILKNERCRAWFIALDQNNDGLVSSEELRSAFLNNGGMRFSESTVKFLMNVFDIDGNSAIAYEEFELLWMYMINWRQMFDSLDTDHDGKIDAAELGTALEHYNLRVSQRVLDNLVKKYGVMPRNRVHGYGQPRRQMELDKFVCASVVVRQMYKLYETCKSGERSQISRDEFLDSVMSLP